MTIKNQHVNLLVNVFIIKCLKFYIKDFSWIFWHLRFRQGLQLLKKKKKMMKELPSYCRLHGSIMHEMLPLKNIFRNFFQIKQLQVQRNL